MGKLGLILGIIVALGIIWFFFLRKKSITSQSQATNPETAQLADLLSMPSMQKDVNIRDIPSQVGLGTGKQEVQDSKEAQKSLLSGDTILGEDAIRALDAKINTVFDSLIPNPEGGGVLVKSEVPEKVEVGNIPIKGMSINKQISTITQSGETVLAPKTKFGLAKEGEKIMSVETVAKKLGRPILTTASGKKFLVLGGRKFHTGLSLTESQVAKFLEAEKRRG